MGDERSGSLGFVLMDNIKIKNIKRLGLVDSRQIDTGGEGVSVRREGRARSPGSILIQYLCYPLQKGKFSHRDRHPQEGRQCEDTEKRWPWNQSDAATSHRPHRGARNQHNLEEARKTWKTIQPPLPVELALGQEYKAIEA